MPATVIEVVAPNPLIDPAVGTTLNAVGWVTVWVVLSLIPFASLTTYL